MKSAHLADILFAIPPEMMQPIDMRPYVSALAALFSVG